MIKKRDYINHLAEVIAEKLGPVLVRSFVRFMNEDHAGAPNASLIVDCTVCPIRRPKMSFDEAKVYYSGKHCMYAIKKEVCVNIRSGTAALVSGGYPGSMPDIEILKMHATEINTLLGGKSILADLGYVGGERNVPGVVVCRRDNPQLRARRVLVECFFGRLKGLFSLFSTTWRLDEKFFDIFFDTACALTNLHIVDNPLQAVDRQFNKGVKKMFLHALEVKAALQKAANEKYLAKRRGQFEPEEGDDSETVEEDAQ